MSVQSSATRRGVFLPLALVELTGDHTAATVLSQIMYWHQGRLRVPRKGTLWLAKSRAEMCAETAITLDQYRRIMPLLVKLGLIVMERGLFNGKITQHIQLTERGLAFMEVSKPPIKLVPKGGPQSIEGEAPNPSRGSALNPLGARPRDDQHRVRTEITDNDLAEDGEGGDGKDPEPTGGEEKEKDQVKAVDILKNHQGSATGSLGAFWKSRMKLIANGKYQKDLTSQENGQLKMLSKYLGNDTRPVIDYAINHWMKFASEAGVIAGVSPPVEPHIGFLLKHHAVAVNLLRPVATPPPPVVEVPVQSVASNTEQEPAYKFTPKELAEWIDELNKIP